MLAEDLIVVVKGRLQRRDDGAIALNCMELSVPDLSEGLNGPLVITMQTHKATEAVVTELGDVLRTHRGKSEVRVHLQGDSRRGDHGPARASAGQPQPVTVRRPQGAARPDLPGQLIICRGLSSRRGDS